LGNTLGEEVDMLQFLRDYVELIQEQNFRQLDQDTKRKALLAFRKASKQVIREAFVVVSTNNNMGDPIVSSNFGVTANAIFVIRDEDPKELEPNGWIPITKLKEGPKTKGLISCGDDKQLRPMVLCGTTNLLSSWPFRFLPD
jgi:superfamily I DNA and/or RNA helicase